MRFKTISGDYYELTSETLFKIKDDFPDRDVEGVLENMRGKLETGRYKYRKRDMLRTIRSWVNRSPVVDADPWLEKLKITTAPSESNNPALVAERGYRGDDPEPVYAPQEKVDRAVAALKRLLEKAEAENAPVLAPNDDWRTCAHTDVGYAYFLPNQLWCRQCGVYMDQFADISTWGFKRTKP